MNTKEARINFDQLIQQYMENLQVTLRGFNPAEEFDFLATFVPSEHPTDSLLELVDLARDGGISRLTMVMEPATFKQIDLSKLPAHQLRKDTNVELEFAFKA